VNRGDVHFIPLLLPDQNNPGQTVTLEKFVVVLRGGQATNHESEVPLLVASTLRMAGEPRPFEVHVDPTPTGFEEETVIDCRWPFTMQKVHVDNYRFRLPADVMNDVSLALVRGLQMRLAVGQ
jgi:mRNA-degrading endonuclease toxin of MazEF toxin-antitoxin module